MVPLLLTGVISAQGNQTLNAKIVLPAVKISCHRQGRSPRHEA